MLTAIAGAVAPSLIGKLFGGKPKEQSTRVNFQQLVDDSQAAGFNPLTALRATGGSGNTTTTLPSLSTSEFIEDSLRSGIGAALNYDPHAEERAKLEVDLMREELTSAQRYNAEKTNTGFMGTGVPVRSTTTQNERNGGTENEDDALYPTVVHDEHGPAKQPARDVGDPDAATQTILGVNTPFNRGDLNTGAGGDVLGEVQNIVDYVGDVREQKPLWFRKTFGHDMSEVGDHYRLQQTKHNHPGNRPKPKVRLKKPMISYTKTPTIKRGQAY